MPNQLKSLPFLKNLCICVLILFILSCGSDAEYIGTYVSGSKDHSQVLELKEEGEGTWKTVDDEVSFKWNIKKGQLRLHFKPSGIVAGNIIDHKFIIQLPGAASQEFVRRDR